MSIFLYDKPHDDAFWMATRNEIKEQDRKRAIKVNFPQLSAGTIDKIAAKDEIRRSLRDAGTPFKTLEILEITMKGKKLEVEIYGSVKALRDIEDKVGKIRVNGTSPTIKEEIQPYVTTFGPENQDLHCSPNIRIQQVIPTDKEKVVHYAAEPGGALYLNESFPEIPRHPSMLTVCTFKGDRRF